MCVEHPRFTFSYPEVGSKSMALFERNGTHGIKWEGKVWYHITFFQEDKVEVHEKVRITNVHEYWSCPECRHKNLNRSFVLMEDHVPPRMLSSRDSYRHVQHKTLGCGACQTLYRREVGPRGGPLTRVNYRMVNSVPSNRAELLMGA